MTRVLTILLTLLLGSSPIAGAHQSRNVLGDKNRGGSSESDPADSRARASDKSDRDDAVAHRRMMREIESLENQCFEEINRIRRARGLRPFDFDENLLEVARDYSRRMAEERFFSHVDPEGRTVKQRIEQASIRWTMVGENLAYAKGSINPVAASMSGWMDSPGHRGNILDPDFRLTAIGVWISSNETVYFTEIFIKQ